MLRENVGVLFDKPGGRRGGGSAEDHPEALFFCFGNNTVKERKVVGSLCFFHPVPGKLTDADHIAAQLQNTVHIRIHQGSVPLLGVVVNT